MHTFKNLSGVETVVGFLTGKEQEIITEDSGKPEVEKIIEAVARLVKRLGPDNHAPTVDSVKQMLTGDFRKAIEQIHLFTLGNPKLFSFSLNYTAPSGMAEAMTMDVDLFHKKTVMVESEVEGVEDKEEEVTVVGLKSKPYKEQFSSYLKMTREDRTIHLTLPVDGREVFYTMPTVGEELEFTKRIKKKEKIGISFKFKLRKLSYLHKGENSEVPIELDTLSLHALDIRAINDSIKENEGDVDSLVIAELPKEALDKAKTFPVDILMLPDFFCLAG